MPFTIFVIIRIYLLPLLLSTDTADLRELAQEVSTLLKNTLGLERFSDAYSQVRNTRALKKLERKREKAQEVWIRSLYYY